MNVVAPSSCDMGAEQLPQSVLQWPQNMQVSLGSL